MNMLTTRDFEIIDFLNEYKVARTSTLSQMFFPSIASCYKRLHILASKKEIIRMRDNVSSEYLYYKKRPKQLKHSLLVTDFYRELSKQVDVVSFKLEFPLGNIRPDALFGYRKNGKNCLGSLEVQISHKPFDYGKYERLYDSGSYKAFIPVFPKIFVVSDNNIVPKSNKFDVVLVQTNFSNLRA